MILNLGSGTCPKPGCVNLDINKDNPDVNVVHDLEQPLPFEDDTFDHIYAMHILEHVRNLPQLMGELHRVGKNGCVVNIDVPHWTNPTFYDDITHVRPWSEHTADFFVEARYEGKRGFKGQFVVLTNAIVGTPWSREKPTTVVVDLQIVKGE